MQETCERPRPDCKSEKAHVSTSSSDVAGETKACRNFESKVTSPEIDLRTEFGIFTHQQPSTSREGNNFCPAGPFTEDYDSNNGCSIHSTKETEKDQQGQRQSPGTAPGTDVSGTHKFSNRILTIASQRIKEGRARKAKIMSRWRDGKASETMTLQHCNKQSHPAKRTLLLHLYLIQLIDQSCERKIKAIRSTFCDPEQAQEMDSTIESARLNAMYWKSRLDREFTRLQKLIAKPPLIPEFICERLTGQLFSDPVITPEGNTYEKSTIQKYIAENGPHDPYTKTRLSLRQLTPNVAMKRAVREFIREHEWAIDFPTSFISSTE